MVNKSHITDYLWVNAEKYPDKLALVCEDKQLTYLELREHVEQVTELIAPSLKPNEQQIVTLLMPNTWQYVVAYLAVLHAGHIAAPIDVIFKPLEINAILHQLPPALIITDTKNRERLSETSAPILNIDELSNRSATAKTDYLRFSAQKQIASLLFTSGTTGKPKAVPYTHANHIWNIKACSEVWGWTNNDTLLISLRLSHMHGIVMGLSGCLYHGNTLYLQDGFDAEKTLQMLASGKISFFTHAAMAYFKLLESKNDYDLSRVRICVSGAAPLPPAIWQKFKTRFGIEIIETYGSTETGRIAANTLEERIQGSPGKTLPGVKVKITPEGEVAVKSAGVFPGYYKNPEATKKSLTRDGYWLTGDLGQIVDGHIILKGRKQERIRKQGYTISPRDVEWALHKNKKINEVLVMGLQSDDSVNDKIIYFLTGPISEEELQVFVKENLPSVWRPDKVFILESLPRNRSGKLDLLKLKEMVI